MPTSTCYRHFSVDFLVRQVHRVIGSTFTNCLTMGKLEKTPRQLVQARQMIQGLSTKVLILWQVVNNIYDLFIIIKVQYVSLKP